MKRAEPRWLQRLVVEAVQVDQVREHGGLIGLGDENLLESALARPKQRWNYDQDADLASLAAAYAFGICRNHPFKDGNKRVAFVASAIFLRLNGLHLAAPDAEVVDRMSDLAAGKLSEDDLADWIRSRTS